jgi:hypothetical protein
MVEQLRSLTGKPAFKVTNGFDIDEALARARLSAPVQMFPGPLRIVYTGMIYRGLRDPEPLLLALSELSAAGRLEVGAVVVEFYGTGLEVAEELARVPAYAPFVRVLGHVSREHALSVQREAGLLLLLESPDPAARGVLTGKLFEYISAGRPILCVGSRPEYEIGQVLRTTGTGVVVPADRPEELRQCILDTLEGGGMYTTYHPRVEEVLAYSRKRLAGYMLERISSELLSTR